MKNIVLIGMMGCGKSTVGALLARRLGWELVDTDQYIQRALGRTIPDIFAREGEAFFRAQEQLAAQALGRREDLVIACGGGLPTREDSIAALKGSGTVVWLRRDPGETYDSLDRSGRPLAQQGREDFIQRFQQREPIYRKWADHIIDSRASAEETAQAVWEVLQHEISHP